MKLSDEKNLLPKNIIRFSKKMVVLSVVLLLVGYGLIVSPWTYGPVVGGVCGGIALGIFFTAGYYWGCENESCS